MAPTKLLYLTDSYLREFEARVVRVEDHSVALERTAFFPRGGGRVADRGWLQAAGPSFGAFEARASRGPGGRRGDQAAPARFPVIAVAMRGQEVFHTIDGRLPEAGETVRGIIDWDSRYQMMRTHSALLVLCGVMRRRYGAQVNGCQMYRDRARVDFTVAELKGETIKEIERETNRAISDGLPIRSRFISRREANVTPELIRTKVDLLPASVDPIRTIEIVGLDLQADGGTHVANTLEIGAIRITRTENKGREHRRMEIEIPSLEGV